MEKTINQQLDELFCTLESTYQEYNKAPDSFNVFDAFRIQRSEVVWSAWIAYLLNPNENHCMGNVFLKLFLEKLGLPENFVLKAETGKHIVERVIDQIGEKFESGGRMDIIIHDPDTNNALIIENKIDADDQVKQLYRYYKYAKKEKFNDFRIFYLTRLKSKPSEKSIKGEDKTIGKEGELQENTDFFCISYIDDIKNWLQDCKDKCDESKPVRSIIEQSINEIDSMCQQTVVDSKFREKMEQILNDYKKTSIKEKLEELKLNEEVIGKYPKCAQKITSLRKIYYRELFDEMINTHFPIANISTEGKTDGYWSSTAHINQPNGAQSILIMHDWPQEMYCGVIFSKLDSPLWNELEEKCDMFKDVNNDHCLLYSTDLNNYDDIYKCLEKVLDLIETVK